VGDYLLDMKLLRYYLVLRRLKRPLGVREVQRILGLNSPGKAQRILKRLVKLGLAERLDNGKYIISDNPPLELVGKAFIRGHLIPRLFFLAVYATVFISLLIPLLKPDIIITLSYILLIVPIWVETLIEYIQLKTSIRKMSG
jgi:hypothetical protein